MFTEAVENILRNLVTPVTIRAIEGGASAQPLWAAFAESGFLELMTSEDNGGAGLSLQAMAPIFVGFGRYAAPLPIAQAIAARVLLERSATAAPHGMITLAGRCVRDADGNVTAPFVPFGMLADLVLGNLDGDTVLLDGAHVFGIVADVEDAAVHMGMKRLDAAVEHLGEAGQVGDVADGEAGVAEGLGGASG